MLNGCYNRFWGHVATADKCFTERRTKLSTSKLTGFSSSKVIGLCCCDPRSTCYFLWGMSVSLWVCPPNRPFALAAVNLACVRSLIFSR